ncbi:DUF167 domain-containing protein [Ottowia thiooxydans]|uniref:DUF167 domain-containing protein n=1 Tax=Ottowia thiooxydans TaxID=219182 RepID=UPI0003F64254|nr:DUF167 domain-containing protein [Ottowia thiooxydans]
MSYELKLSIHAVPGAKRTQAGGAHAEALRVRLAAPPVDGKANAALIEWAANAFSVPKRRVQLLHGETSRQKLLGIDFETKAELVAAQTLLALWMAE